MQLKSNIVRSSIVPIKPTNQNKNSGSRAKAGSGKQAESTRLAAANKSKGEGTEASKVLTTKRKAQTDQRHNAIKRRRTMEERIAYDREQRYVDLHCPSVDYTAPQSLTPPLSPLHRPSVYPESGR